MSNTTRPEAAIGGSSAALPDAILAAASLLAAAKPVVVAGAETDAAGVAAAIALARRLGAVVDHVEAAPCLRDLEAMRGGGWIVTTPLQVRARADTVLLAGRGLSLPAGLDGPPTLMPDRPRRILHVDGSAETVGALRARIARRPIRVLPDGVAELAEILPQARYGAVLWDPARLDVLDVAMLCGLIEDLNACTRFAGLPLEPAGGACAMQVAASLTGLPLPLAFARNQPLHDAFAYDATRMIDAGEADAAIWIGTGPPPWTRRAKLVVLAPHGSAASADVMIATGRPGIDHDAIVFDPALGAIAARTAAAPSAAPSCANILDQIAAALPC